MRAGASDVAVVGCAGFAESETARLAELQARRHPRGSRQSRGNGRRRDPALAVSQSKLVAFSVADTVEDVFACAAAGFSGYVTREAGVDELLGAVRAARDGQMTCSPQIAAALFNRLADRLSPPKAANGASVLTVRERQVLMLYERGLVEQGDRAPAPDQPRDRQEPHPQHPAEAQRHPPRPSRRPAARPSRRPRLTVLSLSRPKVRPRPAPSARAPLRRPSAPPSSFP